MGQRPKGTGCTGRAVVAACALVAGAALVPATAGATPIPARLAPASPFPRVIACELTHEAIAPGIERAAYRMLTAAGPLRVALVIADPANPWVRFDTVVAHDTLGGELETVTSMALRTGAVGGINGDYYAVGADRAPLGVVVRSGELVHAGGARPGFGIRRDGNASIGPFGGGALDGVVTAIGGGPVLLRDGAVAGDPGSTNYAEREMRIPASAVVRFASRKIGLVVVDGRAPAASIGVNRAELVALLRALGAVDALLLDSGGSATLVARVRGEERPSLANVPSDGAERPVADGLFVYSDAPVGPPAALVVRPARITALPGVGVPLTARLVDAAGHALGDAHGAWRVRSGAVARVDPSGMLRAGSRPGSGVLQLERDGVQASVPVRVVSSVAHVTIGPSHANPSSRQRLPLTVGAWDDRWAPVAIGDAARWSARNARIDRHGRLDVAERDAFVTVRVGKTTASARIPVGWHLVPFPVAVRIPYDFSNGGRAAYARAMPPLVAGALLAVACDVTGDGNGEALRLAFVDRFGARESVTLAPAIDFTGVRRLSIGGLVGLAPPLALRDVYVVGTLATPAIRASGSVGVDRCTATLAGA